MQSPAPADRPKAPPGMPCICIFGAMDISLRSSPSVPDFEAAELVCHCFASDENLEDILIGLQPHVIITIGSVSGYPRLMAAELEIRRRWIHFADAANLDAMGEAAYNCYLSVCLSRRQDEPLISIFTPTYRTGARFERTFRSVVAQHYRNWEWIVYDDSGDDGKTADMVAELARGDHRIKLIRTGKNSGIIGDVKYQACMQTTGDILVELDHDDQLTEDALFYLSAAARLHPECGFFYSDFAEVDNHLNSLRYADGWGYGYGGYRTEVYRGMPLSVVEAPNINPKTIRGLVAAPNHLRAWRREVYFAIGGHNRLLPVADDMDIMIRTFLHSRMARIPRLCYLQYHDGTNTQVARNKEIQRLVRYLRQHYDQRIHQRFAELGLDDWIWNHAGGFSDLNTPNSAWEEAASVIVKL